MKPLITSILNPSTVIPMQVYKFCLSQNTATGKQCILVILFVVFLTRIINSENYRIFPKYGPGVNYFQMVSDQALN